MNNKNPRRTAACVAALGLSFLAAALPAYSHHSFAAQYDASKPIMLSIVLAATGKRVFSSPIPTEASNASR